MRLYANYNIIGNAHMRGLAAPQNQIENASELFALGSSPALWKSQTFAFTVGAPSFVSSSSQSPQVSVALSGLSDAL